MLLCGVQEPWTVQELADCVEGSIVGCDFDQALSLFYSTLLKGSMFSY